MRSLILMLVLLSGAYAWSDAIAQSDLEITVQSTPVSPTYAGTPGEWVINVANAGNAQALFAQGETVLQLTLPEEFRVDGFWLNASDLTSGVNTCLISGQTITCTAEGSFSVDPGGFQNFKLFFNVLVAGNYDLLGEGAFCLADPNDVLVELDETNNDCAADLGGIVARALPGDLNTEWLQVNQWSSLVRRYSSATNTALRSEVASGPGNTALHALNEIVRHPLSGDLYVFQRAFETTAFGLGIYTPGAEVSPIGDIGLSIYDAAFSADGTLYALGRDGKLYTLDTATAVPTQRCVTELSSVSLGGGVGKHGALAWDSNEGLVAVGDGKLLFIDDQAFPLDPELDCVSQDTDINLSLGNFFSAEVVDNRLYVMNSSSRLVYIAWDGVGGIVAAAPHDAHGLIAYADDLPTPAVSCLADLYVAATMPFFTTSTSLFGVDLTTKQLRFIRELPMVDVQSIELDPLTKDLLVADAADPRSLFRVSPCDTADAGDIEVNLGVASESEPLFAQDLGKDEIFHVLRSGESLERLNRVSGTATVLGDLQNPSSALVLQGDEVIVVDYLADQSLSTALAFYDLANIAAGPIRTVPLIYGSGLDVGQIREIKSLDSGPDGAPLIGILARTRRSSSSNTDMALPNALVTIGEDGQVEHLVDLPTSVIHIAAALPTTVLKDGFEGDQ